MKNNNFLGLLLLAGLVVACSSSPSSIDSNEDPDPDVQISAAACEDNTAGSFPCHNIDLLAGVSPEGLLGERLNDIWGWTDPQTGREYALVGLTDGVTFVDVSNPEEPVVLGKLPESVSGSSKAENVGFHHPDDEGGNKSAWRDIKVYQNHAFIVSDGQSEGHGLQVFDLERLRDVEDPPVTFSEDVLYSEFENAHNIAINEESGYAYVAGYDFTGGLHMLDIHNPQNPEFVSSFEDETVGRQQTGYVHDTQCVNYSGPDADYAGSEICFNSSETHLLIADVTDKSNMQTVSKADYEGRRYVHQGWLTENHQYFLSNDELDESQNDTPTRTYIWDVRDLDNPEMIGFYEFETPNIDHNLYVRGNRVYEANYTNGLRILSLDNVQNGNLTEVAWFDTHPEDDEAAYDGAWSNYPFFESGIVVVSDMSGGLFILKPDLNN